MTNQNKIYVGNLSYSTTQEGLEAAFGAYGVIEDVKLIRDHETGRSKGFAFITFTKADEAQAALSLDGSTLDERAIRVNIANADNKKRTGGGGRSGGGGHYRERERHR
ncbi:MAG: hypothetical protein Tsb005_15260 [Gammaproteobacteria bacterium]